jgi:hypothetical protein
MVLYSKTASWARAELFLCRTGPSKVPNAWPLEEGSDQRGKWYGLKFPLNDLLFIPDLIILSFGA